MEQRPLPRRPPGGGQRRGDAPSPPRAPPPATDWGDADARLLSGPREVFSTNPPGRPLAELPTIGQIGRYALKYRIGQGGLGTVYAAHDPVLSRLVAIKTVHLELPSAERETFNALFLNEARAAAGLSHPHIVTVFDAGLSDSGAYIAMELLKGIDLRHLLAEGWLPPPEQAARLVCDVAEALAYAHAHGVVHRDIKPANIFMVWRTQPRVLDFGIAHVGQQHELSAAQELAGGSPYYIAPEQLRQQPLDARCDVYALGVVLYELLTGERPFRGETLEAIQRAVLEAQAVPAHQRAPGVPRSLAALTAQAMAGDPDSRFDSAAAMAQALKRWLHERAASGAEPSDPTAAPRRRRRWLAAALSAGVLLAAATWIALPPGSEASPDDAMALGNAARGLVQIEATPWAQVEVDGIGVGIAPPLNQLALPEGRHTVTLRHADAAAHSETVEVTPRRPVVVRHRFDR